MAHFNAITYQSLISFNLSQFPSLYLFSDGYLTHSLELQAFHSLQGDLFKDFYNAVFKIVPVLNYKWQQLLIDSTITTSQIETEPNLKRRKTHVSHLNSNISGELNQNISLYNKLKGTPLIFASSNFHLVHMASQKFLSLDDRNQESLKFELVDFPNDQTVLKFLPCLNFQKLRTNIVYAGDVVCVSSQLQVCNRNPQLFSTYIGQFYEEKEEIFRYYDELHQSEIWASVDDSTFWRVNLYMEDDRDNDEYLYTCDVIALHLSEINLYLNAIREDNNYAQLQKELQKSEIAQFPFLQQTQTNQKLKQKGRKRMRSKNAIFLKNSTLKFETHNQLFPKFQNVTVKQEVAQLKKIFKMPQTVFWKIEAEDYFHGGKVITDKNYRIRHFLSGQYLQIDNGFLSFTEKPSKNSIFIFESMKSTKILKKDTFFYIKHLISNQYLSNILENQQSAQNIFKFEKAEYEEMWETRFLQFCYPILQNAIDYFNNSFIFAINPMLYKPIEIKIRIQFFYIYQKLHQMLELLSSFLKNSIASNISESSDYSNLSKQRQNMIRDENLFPFIIQLLFISFPQSYEFENVRELGETVDHCDLETDFIQRVEAQCQHTQLSVRVIEKLENLYCQKKVELSKTLYQLITNICINNNKNQQKIMNYFDYLQNHLGFSDYIENSLITIFGQNQILLNELTKQKSALIEIVNKMGNLVSKSCPNILKLLACTCKADEPIFANQDILFKTIIEDKKMRDHLLINITSEEDLIVEVYTSNDDSKKFTLSDFFSQEGDPLFFPQQQYLKTQLELFSQLTEGRNKNAHDYLIKKINKQPLIKNAFNSSIDSDMRATLFSLIQNLYIDTDEYTSLTMPNLLREIDVSAFTKKTTLRSLGLQPNIDYENSYEVSTQNKLLKRMFLFEQSSSKKKDNQTQKEFITEFKQELLQYLKNKTSLISKCASPNKVYNRLTLQILKIIYDLLQFGIFYEDENKAKTQKVTTFLNFFDKNNNRVNEDVEQLICYLAKMLEYDQQYFLIMQQEQVKRKYEEVKKRKTEIFASMSIFNTKNDKKQDLKIKKYVMQYDQEVQDPIFKKVRSLKRVLSKFRTKTYTSKNFDLNIEIQIKNQICQILAYLMDTRQNFYLDNTIAFYQDFILKINRNEDIQKFNLEDLQTLLPEEILCAGEDFQEIKQTKEYTKCQIRSFDQILERPFSEVLLLALYFCEHPELENQIVELIQRFTCQKNEFYKHLLNVQLLITPGQLELYRIWREMINEIRRKVQYAEKQNQLEKQIKLLYKIEQSFLSDKESLSLQTKQLMFKHLKGNVVIIKFIDKMLTIIDQNTEDVVRVLELCLSILSQTATNNYQNQVVLYKRIVPIILMYDSYNFGQVKLMNQLFQNNSNLFGQLTEKEFIFFIKLIKLHGKYSEFLDFFDNILESAELNSSNSDIHKTTLSHLFQQENFQFVNPFQISQTKEKMSFFKFYPQQNKYKAKFIKVVARCLKKDVGVSLLTQVSLNLPINDLLDFMLDRCEKVNSLLQENEIIDTQLIQQKSHICDLIRILCENSKKSLDCIFKKSTIFGQIINYQLVWIQTLEQIENEILDYLFDSLLPIISTYTETFIREHTFAIMLSEGRENEIICQFSEYFINNLENMFFIRPDDILCNRKRLKTLKRLAKTFHLQIPKYIKRTARQYRKNMIEFNNQAEAVIDSEKESEEDEEEKLEISINHKGYIQMDDIDSPDGNQYTKIQEQWKAFIQRFKQCFDNNHETLSKIIWNIIDMYDDPNGENRDILIVNEDLLIKLLKYLQNWKINNASKDNILYILKVLTSILKDCESEQEFIVRQNMYDRLNAPRIILILFWEEPTLDPKYLCKLMNFLIKLMQGGNENVQKTVFDLFISTKSCQKLFDKIQSIMDMQIQSINTAHKLNKSETKLVKRVLRILQLFCEGHYMKLQDYLRFQHNQKNSYDLVQLTVSLLSTLAITEYNYEMILQCFETLNEMVVGPCRQNQISIGNSKFLEYAVSVLSEDPRIFQQNAQQIHRGNLARLKYKCLNILVSLLECTESQDSLILRIIRIVPLNVLINNLTQVYTLFTKYFNEEYKDELFFRFQIEIDYKKEESEPYEFIIENGFFIYMLMQLFLQNKKAKQLIQEDPEMNDVLNEFQQQKEPTGLEALLKDNILGEFTKLGQALIKHGVGAMKKIKEKVEQQFKNEEEKKREEELKRKMEQKEMTKKAIQFFRKNTCQMDIVRDDKLYTLYFPKLAFCENLPKDVKDTFHEDVDRTSSKTKLSFLLNQADSIIETMKHEERLRIIFSYNTIFGILASHGKLWEQCAFYNTILLNIVVCLSYSQYFMDERDVEPGDPDYQRVLQNERLRDPRFLFQRQYKQTLYYITTLGITNLVFSSFVVFFFLVKRAPLKVAHIWCGFLDKKDKLRRLVVKFLWNVVQCFFVLLQDFDILYYSIYMLANIVGLTIHPFFFCFHLMDFLKLDQLKTVVQAIWYPKVELGLAILLLLIIEYYFSILAYITFYDHYDDFYYPHKQRLCSEFWRCYFTTYDWTFKYTGSVGARIRDPQTIATHILPQYPPDEVEERYNGVHHSLPTFYSRFFYDNFLNIFLVMILLNMIQGIIIDTFGSLREQQQERNYDQTYRCFICGIDRQRLDKSNDEDKGFFYHIKQEHYMWNYVFYKAYLAFKSKKDFNGNESFVYRKIITSDINWFPIKRAKGVNDDEEEEKISMSVLEQYRNVTSDILGRMEEFQIKLTHFKEFN